MRISKDRVKRFNKEDFALHIMYIMGKDTIYTFSKKIGVDYTTIKKYVDLKASTYPTMTVIDKIARASKDDTITFEVLAKESGYTDAEIAAFKNEANHTVNNEKPRKVETTEKKTLVAPIVAVNEVMHSKIEPIPKKKTLDEGLSLSVLANFAESYDERCETSFYIFDDCEKFKNFGKLVRLHGVSTAMEYATDKESPLFVLEADIIIKFLLDRKVVKFCALNSNKFAVVVA